MGILNDLQASFYREIVEHYCQTLGVSVAEFAHCAGRYPSALRDFYEQRTNELPNPTLESLAHFINDLSGGGEWDAAEIKNRGGGDIRKGTDIACEYIQKGNLQ